MSIFQTLFRKRTQPSIPSRNSGTSPSSSLSSNISSQATTPRPPYLTQTVIFGMHQYRRADEDSSVYFVDEARGIRKQLVDSHGKILHFPGIIREEFWTKEVSPKYLTPQIRFRSSFQTNENGWLFLWQIQPDGWYWADEDGYGSEKDLEVILYTYVNTDGDFTGPFRIYSIDTTEYLSDD